MSGETTFTLTPIFSNAGTLAVTKVGVGDYLLTSSQAFDPAKTITPPFAPIGGLYLPLAGSTDIGAAFYTIAPISSTTWQLAVYDKDYNPVELFSYVGGGVPVLIRILEIEP